MSGGADRTPDELLDELGTKLRAARVALDGHGGGAAAAAARRRRGLRRLLRLSVAVVAASALVGTTAVATNQIWAPAPPAALDHGADAGTPVWVTTAEGGALRVSARPCAGAAWPALSVRVPSGGAGRSCDAARLAVPRVERHLDAARDRTLLYAALPATAARLVVRTRALEGAADRAAAVSVPATAAPAEATERAGLPDGLRYAVAAVPGLRDLASAEVIDADGARVLSCGADGACR